MKEIELDHVELMNQDELPKGFHYPIELRKIMQLGLVNMGVWIIMDKDLAKVRMLEMKRRYNRDLVPFAQRIDGDDLACYEVGSECVHHIQDYECPGTEEITVFPNTWEWLRSAINDMIEYEEIECDCEKEKGQQ